MKTNYSIKIIISILILFISGCGNKNSKRVATAPAGLLYTKINYNWRTVLPNGRFLTPEGKQIIVAPHPFGLTLFPNGKIAVTSNSSVRPFSITIIGNIESENPVVQQIPPGAKNNKKILDDVFMGLAIAPDNKTLYVAGGKEFGSGPNGGVNFKPGPERTYVGFLMKDSVSLLNIPGDEELKADTKKVIQDNFKFLKSSIKILFGEKQHYSALPRSV